MDTNKKRCVISVRLPVYEALKRLCEFHAKRIGLSRRIPITYLIERMVRREFAALAKAGLTIDAAPGKQGGGT